MRFVDKTEKFIRIVLIFCIGGVGSLAFIDAFSPHHGSHVYHLSILENEHTLNPLPPPSEVLINHFYKKMAGQLLAPVEANLHQSTNPGSALFFQTGLSSDFLLTQTDSILLHYPALISSTSAGTLPQSSAWLPPLMKPPRFV